MSHPESGREVDVIIVGQGVAGTCLAWQLHFEGVTFAIIDNNPEVSSSKIAAGLMTPITGKKLALMPDWDFYWKTSSQFYHRIELEVKRQLFYVRPSLRIFKSEEERELYLRKSPSHYPQLVREPAPALKDTAIQNEYGCFEMPGAGQLAMGELLEATREFFDKEIYHVDLNHSQMVKLTAHGKKQGVEVESLRLSARYMIFCEGAQVVNNPWFQDVEMVPAKGEILTIKAQELSEHRVMHHHLWVVPQLHKGGDK